MDNRSINQPRHRTINKTPEQMAVEITEAIMEIRSRILVLVSEPSSDENEEDGIIIQKLANELKNLLKFQEDFKLEQLTLDEKERLLKPENLSQLSTAEYITLWKRLNPYYVSHVIRQGYRDHTAMFEHSAGVGKLSNGLKEMFTDKRLKSPIAIREKVTGTDPKTVLEYLTEKEIFNAPDKKSALELLKKVLNSNPVVDTPKFADKSAVHFAGQAVLDEYYGAEKDNEAFIIFPADVIASQYSFRFSTNQDFHKPCDERKWNDLFVWQESIDSQGIDINAGLLFLPKSTLVDPETGSKYQQAENQEVAINHELIDSLTNVIEELVNNQDIIKLAQRVPGDDYYSQKQILKAKINEFLQEINIPADQLEAVAEALAKNLQENTTIQGYEFILGSKYLATSILEANRLKFMPASNPITAQKYWENYFSKHPEKKPNHIVFYDGNPQQAVKTFLENNGIINSQNSKPENTARHLGFEQNYVQDMATDPRSNAGFNEFLSQAETILDQHYS